MQSIIGQTILEIENRNNINRIYFKKKRSEHTRQTQSASSAVGGHFWQMCGRVELNGLVAAVVARHVTFSAVDAHFLVSK